MDYRSLLREAREALARTAEEADATKRHLLEELDRHQKTSRKVKAEKSSQCCFDVLPNVPLLLLEPFPSLPQGLSRDATLPLCSHDSCVSRGSIESGARGSGMQEIRMEKSCLRETLETPEKLTAGVQSTKQPRQSLWSQVFSSEVEEVPDVPSDHVVTHIQQLGHVLSRWDESGQFSSQLQKISMRLLATEDEQARKLRELEEICCASLEAAKREAADAQRELRDLKVAMGRHSISSPITAHDCEKILFPRHQFLRKRDSERRQSELMKRKVAHHESRPRNSALLPSRPVTRTNADHLAAHKTTLEREYGAQLGQYKSQCEEQKSQAHHNDLLAHHKHALEVECGAKLQEQRQLLEEEFAMRLEATQAERKAPAGPDRKDKESLAQYKRVMELELDERLRRQKQSLEKKFAAEIDKVKAQQRTSANLSDAKEEALAEYKSAMEVELDERLRRQKQSLEKEFAAELDKVKTQQRASANLAEAKEEALAEYKRAMEVELDERLRRQKQSLEKEFAAELDKVKAQHKTPAAPDSRNEDALAQYKRAMEVELDERLRRQKQSLEKEFAAEVGKAKAQYKAPAGPGSRNEDALAQFKRAMELELDEQLRRQKQSLEKEFAAELDKVKAQQRASANLAEAKEEALADYKRLMEAEVEERLQRQKQLLEKEFASELEKYKRREFDELKTRSARDLAQHKQVVEEECSKQMQRYKRELDEKCVTELEERKEILEREISEKTEALDWKHVAHISRLKMTFDEDKERMVKVHQQEVKRLRDSITHQQQVEKTGLEELEIVRQSLRQCENELKLQRVAAGVAAEEHAQAISVYEDKWVCHQAEVADALEQEKLRFMEAQDATRSEIDKKVEAICKQKLQASDVRVTGLKDRLHAAEEFIGQNVLNCVTWKINDQNTASRRIAVKSSK